MSVPVTTVHILRLLMQADQNLSGLQLDMRRNAETWKTAAIAQSIPRATLAEFMDSAAGAYQTRLAWIATAQADTANWTRLSSLWTRLGGTAADFSDIVTPLTAVANQLGPANKASYAAIITVCDAILGAIDKPLSLWPE